MRNYKMKKIISILLLVNTVVLVLSACRTETVTIDDCKWQMRTVMSNDIELANSDAVVLAVGEENEVYPNAQIVELTLIASNGKVTVTDATSSKTYEGTYSIDGKTSNGTIYSVTIDGKSGYATAEMTQNYNEADEPTLTINLGDWSLYFYTE